MHLENEGLKTFQELAIPGETRIAGWAALAQALGVKGPVRKPGAVSARHVSPIAISTRRKRQNFCMPASCGRSRRTCRVKSTICAATTKHCGGS
jgi:hypothetical protein